MTNVKNLYLGLITVGLLLLAGCELGQNNTPNLEESLELFAGLETVPEAQNSTLTINKGRDLKSDGYFKVRVSNVLPHGLIKNVETEAWCLEWKKPLRSNGDVHEGIKWFSTTNNDKWKPINYLFSIRNELFETYEDLTFLEIQSVVWTLAGQMGLAPEFNIDKLRVDELPGDLRAGGEIIVNREYIREITEKVLTEYSTSTFTVGGFALQTASNEQDVFVPIPPSRIELLPDPLSIGVGETRTMNARVFDENGDEIENPEINWSILDGSTASVDQNGVVTGLSVGQTTIVAESGGTTASATVDVNQIVDNVGNDFIIGMLPNPLAGSPIIEIHLTSDVATTVTVDYPINNPIFTVTVDVTPGNITVVEVPNSSSESWSAGTIQNNAIRASSNQDFVMYAVNRTGFTSDAALNLPINVLGEQYLITTTYSNVVSQDRGLFSVVAAFDNTEVTITPSNNLAGGFSAEIPFTINLNRGEGFLASSVTSGINGDLTGSTVESTQPVSVTNGNLCTNVPPNTTACDHVFQAAHPLFSWANEMIAAPLPNRPFGSVYRVVASMDNTTLQQNGSVVATLNSGEFYETTATTGAQVFTANNPIFSTQYMTGVTGSGSSVGDPAMGSLIPTEQYLSAYTFSTVGGAQFAQHWLNIIAHNDDVSNGTVLLDGSVVPFADFTAISGTSFSYAQIQLTEGTHSTVSGSNPHGIYVMGFNSADSYLYPGGAGISVIE